MSASVISPINKERRKPNCETVKKETVKRLLGPDPIGVKGNGQAREKK